MTLVRIDIDRSPAAARRYGVSSVPTMFVFRNGQVMGRFSGLPMQDELKQFVAEAREKSQPQPDSSRCASLAGGAPDLALCN
jgi:thioredoxin-like negative regulator of GroEL